MAARVTNAGAIFVGPWAPVSLAMFAAAWGGNEFTPLLVAAGGLPVGVRAIDLVADAFRVKA